MKEERNDYMYINISLFFFFFLFVFAEMAVLIHIYFDLLQITTFRCSLHAYSFTLELEAYKRPMGHGSLT